MSYKNELWKLQYAGTTKYCCTILQWQDYALQIGCNIIFQILQLTFTCTYLYSNHTQHEHTLAFAARGTRRIACDEDRGLVFRMRCGRPYFRMGCSVRSWQDWRRAYTCGFLQFCCTPVSRRRKKRFDSSKVCCIRSAGGPLFSHDELTDSLRNDVQSFVIWSTCLQGCHDLLRCGYESDYVSISTISTALLCACFGACLV